MILPGEGVLQRDAFPNMGREEGATGQLLRPLNKDQLQEIDFFRAFFLPREADAVDGPCLGIVESVMCQDLRCIRFRGETILHTGGRHPHGTAAMAVAELFAILQQGGIKIEIQRMLGIGKSRTYLFLDEVYRNKKPFRVIKVGKLYRVPVQSFDDWLNGSDGDG